MLFSASILASLGIGLIKHEPSFLLKGYLRGMFSIIILLIIYLPIYYTIGEHLILTMVILFISIFISELIVEKIKLEKHQQKNQILGAILIILNFIIFTYLTYNPIKVDLFYDHASKKYGIDILNK